MMRFKFAPLISALLLLGACSSDPLPDYRYYRLPQSDVAASKSASASFKSLEVQYFRASGVLNERPILYVRESSAEKLSQYHYQIWSDPPGMLLQRRFVEQLSQAGIADLVSARVNPRAEPAVLTGEIERFERVKPDSETAPWKVAVGIRIRVEKHGSSLPTVEKSYLRVLSTEGDTMEDAIAGFGRAVDEIAAELATDVHQRTSPSQRP